MNAKYMTPDKSVCKYDQKLTSSQLGAMLHFMLQCGGASQAAEQA